ncbi:Transcriptional regulatory protein ZraR [uncultured Clostridium sp.]|uniref:sigma 54-interacting transcriptional regulator n=1 Tax=Enterocloster citroniae TaxID=358743 RepID=UPI000821B115|nr:sigma 54-interacting transcriptional regulator [Enterocloster citroniae]MCB7064980.1 sigma 54-interacting transcriptional regulator [Enterocloster citroniae]MCD8279704.1 sigma 54-interacting transcriptional regulator [Enterocloster citroniae]SCI23026.1 Transcriptional regulatory protein ZraR [uncultured Clostridium sp.]
MKKKLLVLTNNPVAKIGIASYLSSIFNQYLTIQAARGADATPELMESADCILLTTENVKDNLLYPLPEQVYQMVCMRTFNHTYLHKILQIPPGSSVYLVNDTEENANEVILQLQEYGFSQYHFLPWFPGCTDPDPDIHYGVTPGELHLVPSTLSTVIDMGNRVVDISTINEIIAWFHLPISLADEVTRNYISHIVQVLKLSNQQLSHALDMKQITQVVLDNVSEGFCLLDENGMIKMANHPFRKLTGFKEKNLVGRDFHALLASYGIEYDFPKTRETIIGQPGHGQVRLWFQRFSLNPKSEIYLLHATECEDQAAGIRPSGSTFPFRTRNLYDFNNMITRNPTQTHLLDTARRISLNDFPVIIQGESGTEKAMLAQAIHRNSRRHDGPFVSLNFSSLNPSGIEAELLGTEENASLGTHRRLGAFRAASGGTLLINGIHHTAPQTQQLLLNVLQNGYYMPIGSSEPMTLDVRIIATTTKDLYGLVLEGRFLDDLFFLLNTFSLNTVPIRQRRDDIPLLLNSLLKDAFKDPTIFMEGVLTEHLITFLKQYDWPGNAQEMNNLCNYFSCIYQRERIPLSDLPGYILNQILSRQTSLDVTEKHILSLIIMSPRIGRASIQEQLLQMGITLSEGKIRTVLKRLAEDGCIKVHRTRGGCEATELGILMSR